MSEKVAMSERLRLEAERLMETKPATLHTIRLLRDSADELDRLRAQTLESPATENIAAYVDVVRALGLFAAVHGLGTTGPTTETLPVIAWLERLVARRP